MVIDQVVLELVVFALGESLLDVLIVKELTEAARDVLLVAEHFLIEQVAL